MQFLSAATRVCAWFYADDEAGMSEDELWHNSPLRFMQVLKEAWKDGPCKWSRMAWCKPSRLCPGRYDLRPEQFWIYSWASSIQRQSKCSWFETSMTTNPVHISSPHLSNEFAPYQVRVVPQAIEREGNLRSSLLLKAPELEADHTSFWSKRCVIFDPIIRW